MKVLDSDHCVALLRGRLDLKDHVSPDEKLAITATSVGELIHGAYKSQRIGENLARLDVLFVTLEILPYDEIAARCFGQIKARLELAGEKIEDLDLEIAGTVLVNDCILVTHNQAHFARLTSPFGLVLEDWLG